MRDIIYAHQNRISTYNLFRLAIYRRREYDRNRRAALRSRQTESERQESMSTRNEQCRLRRLAESPDESIDSRGALRAPLLSMMKEMQGKS